MLITLHVNLLINTSFYLSGPAVIKVKEGTDVMLPCSLSTKENITSKLFDWKKVAQKDEGLKEVFLYDGGSHYNNGLRGQSEEFKGRVSHFQDELKHGNASIIIRNTKISDNGGYTCDFPRLQPPQTFNIELVVSECYVSYLIHKVFYIFLKRNKSHRSKEGFFVGLCIGKNLAIRYVSRYMGHDSIHCNIFQYCA
uniref:Ig-like domain-containing protein n=1 Tax=Sander lucioperca TaxID=283035 RepID=A0A8C9XGN4_SANLU